MRKQLSMPAAMLLAILLTGLAGCSDNSDVNGDGQVSRSERAEEMRRDGYLAMQPGRWRTSFTFSDIDVPRISAGDRARIAEELSTGASGVSCLSASEAAQPGPDFFGGEGAEDCNYRKFDIAGNHVNMALSCGMGNMGKVDMDLDGTVGDVDFLFDTKFVVHVPIAGKIKLAGTMTGKHEGACRGDE